MGENNNTKNFMDLVKEMDVHYTIQRDRGTLFEILSRTYLKNEPMYVNLFEEVWLLNEVPDEYGIPKTDTGIDLVAKERDTGNLVAIQCKYYSQDTTIQKKHIDSFFNEVGKKYYSKGIIITSTDKWSKNAEEALLDRDKKVIRISLTQLQESVIDWSEFNFNKPDEIKKKTKKTPRKHQLPAIEAVINGLSEVDRGKLIMAPGTGKTYTSLAIAEELAKQKKDTFRVLYLVPSIQLLSQTLRGWTADSIYSMDAIAVCSDKKVTKKENSEDLADIMVADIGYPATTNAAKLMEYKKTIESKKNKRDFLTVFSTYQSIDVVIEAQNKGFYEFDLVICDEAHRTTGSTELNKDESSFTKVHDNNKLKAKKRLYQTATPRIYGEAAKKRAEEYSVVIADMDNSSIYGREFFRLGFGEAIQKGILTDYKVMILAVDEAMVARQFQDMFANKDSALEFNDVTKIVGCWNGLVRRISNSDEVLGPPMKRAIAFTSTINNSKLITDMFEHVVNQYLNQTSGEISQYKIEIEHADGSMNALQKNKKISWLKSEVPEKTCRILSNARFLTEGVDVPELDAVMFLSPRKSKIDIAQAVGRVMRKSSGKNYGYVILPVGVKAGSDSNTVLDNNEKYKAVWEVLNALRSLDERFDATINKLELNKKKPNQIGITEVGDPPIDGILKENSEQLEWMLTEEALTDLEKAIYGKIVRKVGNVKYWEEWSKDITEIAQQHIIRIQALIDSNDSILKEEFNKFIISLRNNINDSIDESEAIEMLAQHLITKPVFEALFSSYSFATLNPVSKAMNQMIEYLTEKGLTKEQDKLQKFYDSVKVRAEGIDNLKAKQDIIIQLYEKFFSIAFKKTTDQLGVVFTPVEVVDFIIKSTDFALRTYLGKSLSEENVHILDPFTGTGTFVTRLLQSNIIKPEDLLRKYMNELHANERILLSYYIAAINIEETFHSLMDENSEYISFNGIVLTDTFEGMERKNSFEDELFNENQNRIKRQENENIYALIGNPPYNARQNNENDMNKKKSYPVIDSKIKDSYAKYSKATNKNTLYDSLIRAFRWATDRIGEKGVIGFVTNGSYIDTKTAAGIRKCFYDDFNYIYIFNLRGDQRTQGEQSLKEGGKIFGSGSRNGIVISILIKDGSDNHKLFYNDIGDYLTREAKLEKISNYESIENMEWETITPDENNDWLNQRKYNDSDFSIVDTGDNGIFIKKSLGISTNRDSWIYGFNKDKVESNMMKMISNYNNELERLKHIKDPEIRLQEINSNLSYISWSGDLKKKFSKSQHIKFKKGKMSCHTYRPFVKKWLYYDSDVIERPRKWDSMYNEGDLILVVPNNGSKRDFACLVVDSIPDLNLFYGGAQGFTLYNKNNLSDLFQNELESNINLDIQSKLKLPTEEIFYYIYGVMHSPEYRELFENDLKKAFPKIPNLKNKTPFIEIGRKLINLHVNYEKVSPFKDIKIEFNGDTKDNYMVEKMKIYKDGDQSFIQFNKDIKITNIPDKAFKYNLNGRSAIEWIIEFYQIKDHKDEGIIDNANEFSSNPKYIFDLLLSIINLSVQTVDLINKLPKMEFID